MIVLINKILLCYNKLPYFVIIVGLYLLMGNHNNS